VLLRKTADNLEQTGTAHGSVTASYWRQGGVRTAITPAALGSVNAAHSDGGWIEVDATNQPGLYRFDVPDAAFASGADWVIVSLKVSGCYVYHERFNLGVTDADLRRIDGLGVDGHNATLRLKVLSIQNNDDAAVVIVAGDGNAVDITGSAAGISCASTSPTTGHGINLAGSGAGHGLTVTGGPTGNGLRVRGGSTSGDAINAAAVGSGHGATLVAVGGSKYDLDAQLGPDALDGISTTGPNGVAANFRERLNQLWRRFFGKADAPVSGNGNLRTYRDDGTTLATTQAVSNDGTTETQGAAT
jgi:hypothetical protein